MKVITTRVICKRPHLLMNETSYIDNAGKERSWHWAERPHNVSAVSIAAMHGDCIVMIREFRVPLNDYIWEFPAGLVDRGETVEKAADREMLEETGLTIVRYIRSVSPPAYTSPGLTDERLTLVFANVEGVPSTSLTEASEDIEVHLLTRLEAASVIQSGDKIDAKAYLTILRFVEDGTI